MATPNAVTPKPAEKPSTKIKVGPCVGSYANIFKPRAVNEGDEPKYSISLLFDKKAPANSPQAKTLAELKKMIAYVAAQKFGPKWNEIRNFKNPVRDGDVEKPDHKEYADRYFANASSTRPPGVVNRQLVPITTDQDAYSGCLFVAAVNVYAFDKKGSKGVALGLNNLCVFEKGERIDGRKDAAEDFAEYVGDGEPAGGAEESPLD
jgi:hypothetical protein